MIKVVSLHLQFNCLALSNVWEAVLAPQLSLSYLLPRVQFVMSLRATEWALIEGDVNSMTTCPLPVWHPVEEDVTDFWYMLFDFAQYAYNGLHLDAFTWNEGIAMLIKAKTTSCGYMTLNCFDIDSQIDCTVIFACSKPVGFHSGHTVQ